MEGSHWTVLAHHSHPADYWEAVRSRPLKVLFWLLYRRREEKGVHSRSWAPSWWPWRPRASTASGLLSHPWMWPSRLPLHIGSRYSILLAEHVEKRQRGRGDWVMGHPGRNSASAAKCLCDRGLVLDLSGFQFPSKIRIPSWRIPWISFREALNPLMFVTICYECAYVHFLEEGHLLWERIIFLETVLIQKSEQLLTIARLLVRFVLKLNFNPSSI